MFFHNGTIYGSVHDYLDKTYEYVASGEKVKSRNGSVATTVIISETEEQDSWDRVEDVFTVRGSQEEGKSTSGQTGIPCYISWCAVEQ